MERKMSKYEKLWNYIEENSAESFSLNFDENLINRRDSVSPVNSFFVYKKKLEGAVGKSEKSR